MIRSPFEDIELPTESLPSIVFSDLDERRDKIAVICEETGAQVSYGELHEQVIKVATGLSKAGFRVGDTLALWMPDCIEHVIVFYAVAYLGGATTGIVPSFNAYEGTQRLRFVHASFVVTSSDILPVVIDACRECHSVQKIFVTGDFQTKKSNIRPFSELSKYKKSKVPDVKFDIKETVAFIPFSSGDLKAVELTHFSLATNMLQFLKVVRWNSERVLGGQFHKCYGVTMWICITIMSGSILVISPSADYSVWLSLLEKHRASIVFAPPAFVAYLAKEAVVEKYTLYLKTIFTGGQKTSNEVCKTCCERLGCTVRPFFGMKELSGLASIGRRGSTKYNSIGRLLPNMCARIVCEEGFICGRRERGELCIQGPSVMKEYRNNPYASSDIIYDGWLHTGDVAYFDEDLDIFIVDRKRELITVRNDNGSLAHIAPAEIESVLYSHPMIAEAAVIGVRVPETVYHLVKAYVALKEGAEMTEDEVRNVCRRVQSSKYIDDIVISNHLPKSDTGKISRRLLRRNEEQIRVASICADLNLL
eukprot:175704_1